MGEEARICPPDTPAGDQRRGSSPDGIGVRDEHDAPSDGPFPAPPRRITNAQGALCSTWRGHPVCRWCRGRSGHLVLDLGNQPACDHFPDRRDPGPDPGHPLQMWLCSACGLAQLVGEPTVADEPRGAEPEALVAQAADAVERLETAGWLSGRDRVVEFASPHGGSWLGLLAERGLAPVTDDGTADLVIDSFGMMHDRGSVRRPWRSGRPGSPPGAPSCCSTTRWTRSSVSVSGTLSGTDTSRTTRRVLWSACWEPSVSVHGSRGVSTSTAARCCWPRSRESGPRGAPDKSVTALLSDDARAGGSRPRCRRGPAGSRRSPRPRLTRLAGRSANAREGVCWATAPRRGRSHYSVAPGWIDSSSPRLLTPHRPNTAFACRGRTFPSSARQVLVTRPPRRASFSSCRIS